MGSGASSSGTVQRYDGKTVCGSEKVEPLLLLLHTGLTAYARVFHPYACLRSGDIVTASLHHGGLYSATLPQPFVPPSGPAGLPFRFTSLGRDHRRHHQHHHQHGSACPTSKNTCRRTPINNALNASSHRRDTAHWMTTSPSNAPC